MVNLTYSTNNQLGIIPFLQLWKNNELTRDCAVLSLGFNESPTDIQIHQDSLNVWGFCKLISAEIFSQKIYGCKVCKCLCMAVTCYLHTQVPQNLTIFITVLIQMYGSVATKQVNKLNNLDGSV